MNQYFDIDVNSTTSYSAILLKLLIIEHRDEKKTKIERAWIFFTVSMPTIFSQGNPQLVKMLAYKYCHILLHFFFLNQFLLFEI